MLLTRLEELTRQIKQEVEAFRLLPEALLNQKQQAESWSVLECIEHLNRYGNFYIPELTLRINHTKFKSPTPFKPGLLGNYFAESMLPKETIKKMKTFPSMNPNHSKLTTAVLDVFIQQQNTLLTLLEQARTVDLNKTKTSISITKWIKLKLGDTFRVVIYHNLRHIEQAKNTLNYHTTN